MDNSETYIKMCEKAVEVQALCVVNDVKIINSGDLCYHPKSQSIWTGYIVRKLDEDILVWLPRQDQLQAMVRDEHNDWIKVLSRFAIFAFGGERVIDGTPHSVFSMEQLWLAFVMKEKYNKVWNGTDWVLSEVLVEK